MSGLEPVLWLSYGQEVKVGTPNISPLPGAGWFTCRHSMDETAMVGQGWEPRRFWGSGWVLCQTDWSDSGLLGQVGTRALLRGTTQNWKGRRKGCWESGSDRPFIPLICPFSQLRTCHILNHLHYFSAFHWMEFFLNSFWDEART